MLKDTLKNDLNASLKAGDQLKRSVLGMVMTTVKNRELAKRQQLSKTVTDFAKLESDSQLTDNEVLEVFLGEVKKRKESIEQFRAGGREELVAKEQAEIDILMSYMPKQMAEADVRDEIAKTISDLGASGAKDMGKVIGAVMAKLKGRADGALVSKIAKELLV